jgi:hypothetical protein
MPAVDLGIEWVPGARHAPTSDTSFIEKQRGYLPKLRMGRH